MPTERTALFNRARILWCCQQNKLTVKNLADDLGYSPTALNTAINNEGALTIGQLQKIADYFHRPLLFFFEQGPINEAQADSPQFRTISSQKPELARKIKILVKRAEEQRQVFIELLEGEEDYTNTNWQTNRIQKAPQETVKAFAVRVREWLGIEDKEDKFRGKKDFEYYRIALEKIGMLVFVTNGYAGKWQIEKDSPIRGFSLYFDFYPVIVVKKQDSPAAQCFTLMHELAHLLLHRISSIDEESDLHNHQGAERESNEFAGNLLVPDYLLNGISLTHFPFSEVNQYDNYLKSYRDAWGVSGDVIVRRLYDEGYLGQDIYRQYLAYKTSIPQPAPSGGGRYRYGEPLKMFGRLFVGVVLDALHDEQITINKASKYLDNLQITDLRQLERRIAHF